LKEFAFTNSARLAYWYGRGWSLMRPNNYMSVVGVMTLYKWKMEPKQWRWNVLQQNLL